MCGICGYAGLNDLNLLSNMTRAISHRGIDDEGFYTEDNIGLGHRRLSIIDISKGKQPIHNEDETIWIVFNGEIYNYKNLKYNLEKQGHKFYTETDTEVIVHLYEQYGERCLEYLDGMFAFAIWDSKGKSLFLARDRLGKKPLYYTLFDNKFLFASEIKSILEYKEIKREVDIGSLQQFLNLGYTMSPKTMFKNIYKLSPGNALIYKDNNVSINKYWSLKNFTDPHYCNNVYDCSKQIKNILTNSVKDRLISDVPLGVFLSGGLDSSSIVGIMNKELNTPIKTITAIFEDEKCDESRYAKIVSDYFNTEHHEIFIDNSKVVDLIPKIIWHFDEPILDMSAIPEYLISEKAKKIVSVVLTGEGSDEVFGGYLQHRFIPKVYNNYTKIVPNYVKEHLIYNTCIKLQELVKTRSNKRYLNIIGKLSVCNTPQEIYNLITEVFSIEEVQEITNNSYNKNINIYDTNSMTRYETLINLPNNYLMNLDKMTMAHSLESRSPFLDYKLVEFVNKIPYSVRFKEDKYLLKLSMKDILPKEILRRKKHSFNVPVAKWFEEGLTEYCDTNINNKILNKYLNKDYVSRVMNKDYYNNNQKLALMYFLIWHETFIY